MLHTFYILNPVMNFLILLLLLCCVVLPYSVAKNKEPKNNLKFIYKISSFNRKYVLMKFIVVSYCNKMSRLQQRGLGRTGISTINFHQRSTYSLTTSKEGETLKSISVFDKFYACKDIKKNRQKNMQKILKPINIFF